jgi:hypothetical protein
MFEERAVIGEMWRSEMPRQLGNGNGHLLVRAITPNLLPLSVVKDGSKALKHVQVHDICPHGTAVYLSGQ